MASQVDLYRVFNVFLKNDRVTTNTFLSNGFGKSEIENFINDGIISKLGDFYILKRNNVGLLSNYGISFLLKDDLKTAKKCFLLCVSLNNEKKQYNFLLFVVNVMLKCYDEAIEYFEDISLDQYSVDDYFFLYMFKYILDTSHLPQVKKEEIVRMAKDSKYYKFILNCLDYRFIYAKKDLLEAVSSSKSYTPYSFLGEAIVNECQQKLISLKNIKECIQCNRLLDGKLLIKEYLIEKRLNNYINLFNYIFKLDNGVLLAFNTLLVIQNGEIINVEFFIKLFYECLESKDRFHARMALKILSELTIIGYDINFNKYKVDFDRVDREIRLNK